MPPRRVNALDKKAPQKKVQRDVASLWEVDVTAALTSGIVRVQAHVRRYLVKNRPNDEIVRRLAELRKQRRLASLNDEHIPPGVEIQVDLVRDLSHRTLDSCMSAFNNLPSVKKSALTKGLANAVQWLSVILDGLASLTDHNSMLTLVRDVQVRRPRNSAQFGAQFF